MVRASTSGMIDFRKFDPWDAWWWRNLRWVLDELELRQTQEICRVQHSHWITLASHGNLTPDSFDKAKTNAGAALNKLLKATFPWLADKIGADGTKTEREDAVTAYQQEFGKPGEPRYEAMIDTITKALRNGPLTQREKERDRARRRARREAEAQGG
jgi:hypothetical protein